MRLAQPALAAHLGKRLAAVYHLFGAEVLLVEEALESLRAAAAAAGFASRQRFYVEPGFDWGKLLTSGMSMSLLADKTMTELRIPSGKPGESGGKIITRYVQTLGGDDRMLVIISGAIDKRSQQSKWFKAAEAAGVAVECPAIAARNLPDWIGKRMRAKGLQFAPDAVARLTHFVEGNLLAAAQAINLLALLSAEEKITAEKVDSVIADHARFSVYTFVDVCLAGAAPRCTRILQSLRRERAEPVLILWAMAKEVRLLCQIAEGLAGGAKLPALFKKHAVWSSRAGLVGGAVKRLPRARCYALLRRLARADLMLKGRAEMQRADIWEEIESIGLAMCGVRF